MMKKMENKFLTIDDVKFDKCVLCGIKTKYKKTDDTIKRLGYIKGAGQLCFNCFIQGFQCG